MPPALRWIDGYVLSVSQATNTVVQAQISSTVNPLVFRVKIKFSEPLSGKNMMLVWNLFQMYATRNESVPKGRKPDGALELQAEIIVKRRLGPAMNDNPAE